MRLTSLLPRLALGALITYLVLIGATFNGILTPQIRLTAVIVLGVSMAIWLVVRARARGGRWHHTALDAAMVLWVVAFGVSLLGNTESWRRIVMGLWYMGAYIVLWYALNDLVANRLVTRVSLVLILLFAGLMIILMAYVQVQTWMRDSLPAITAGEAPLVLPRPVSTLGNPNTLASALVMLLPLSVGWMLTSPRRFVRLLMALYSLAALGLLFLTYSRGGWLAAAAGLGALFLGLLWDRDFLSPARWRAWWRAQSRGLRVALLSAAGLALVALVIGAALFIHTFTIGGRTLDLRTFLYDTALTMFAEKPLTGNGLFTFGAGLARLNSVPPVQPHSHAHDLPLQVAAEMGIFGIAALALTVVLIVRAVRANLREAQTRAPRQLLSDRTALILATSAFVAFCAHHIPDLAAMNPAIMILALVALAAAAAPVTPRRFSPAAGRALNVLAVVGCGVLVVSGLWGSFVYGQYTDAVSYGINSRDYVEAAARLEPVIAADPDMAVYHQQRGFLLGLAAAEGDTTVLPDAIAEFERYTDLAPYYSLGWANLASLYAQAGQLDRAVEAMERAVALAPDAPAFTERLASYRAALTTGSLNEPPIEQPVSVDRDSEYLPDINHIQWLRLSIQRQLLPQVHYYEPTPEVTPEPPQ